MIVHCRPPREHGAAELCCELSLCARGHTVQRDDIRYHIFCFADATHAERFRIRFGGDPFDSKDRGRGSAWFLWRKRQPGRGA
jgi:hypothetical protein